MNRFIWVALNYVIVAEAGGWWLIIKDGNVVA